MTTTIMFFNNGNTAVFDERDQQMDYFQEPWLLIYARWLKAQGQDLSQVKFQMPNGRTAQLDGENNWRIL